MIGGRIYRIFKKIKIEGKLANHVKLEDPAVDAPPAAYLPSRASPVNPDESSPVNQDH